jgi:hypothetical protein
MNMPLRTNTDLEWAADEAALCAQDYLEWHREGTGRDELHQSLIRDRAHWAKVFNDAVLMNHFTEVFNSTAGSEINIFM